MTEIRTWQDVLEALKKATPEQLAQPVKICESFPMDEHVHELQQGICLATVDELDLRYARSVLDNRRHGDHLVIFTDGNPFGEDGAIAYQYEAGEHLNKNPIYPKGYDDSQNWTGPAQKLADKQKRKRGKGVLGAILVNRLSNYNNGLKGEA